MTGSMEYLLIVVVVTLSTHGATGMTTESDNGTLTTTPVFSTTIDYSDDTPWYLRLYFLLPTLGVGFLLGCFFAFMGCRAFGQAHCPKYCPDNIPDPEPEKPKDDKKDTKKSNKIRPLWISQPPEWMVENETTKAWIEQPPSWMGTDGDQEGQPSWIDNPPAWMRETPPMGEFDEEEDMKKQKEKEKEKEKEKQEEGMENNMGMNVPDMDNDDWHP